MPRQSQIKPNERKEIRQQDTFRYAEQLKVSARPVDANVQYHASKEAQGIMEAFNLGADSLVKVNNSLNKDAREQGELLGDINGQLPENPRQAMLDGYHSHRGGADTLAYSGELEALGLDLPTPEYEQKRKELSDKYTSGKSDAYLQGFVPKALHFEQQHELKHQKKQLDNYHEGWLSDASSIFMSETIANKGDPAKMRESLSNLQDRGVAIGLDRTKAGKAGLRALGAYAESTGRPELLDFIGIPDAHGTKIIDTELGHEALQIRNRALRQSEHNITVSERNQAKASDAVEMDIIKAIDGGDMGSAKQLVNQYSRQDSNIKLSPEKAEHFYKAIRTAEKGDGDEYPKKTPPRIYTNLKVKSDEGTLTIEDLNTTVESGQLSYPDFKELVKGITDKKETPYSPPIKSFIESGASSLKPGPNDKWEDDEKERAGERVGLYKMRMHASVKDFITKNKTEPNDEELLKLSRSVKERIKEEIPKVDAFSKDTPQGDKKKALGSALDSL